jgi:hypothetical protein
MLPVSLVFSNAYLEPFPFEKWIFRVEINLFVMTIVDICFKVMSSTYEQRIAFVRVSFANLPQD